MSFENDFNPQESVTHGPLPDKLRCRFINARGIRCQHRLFDHYCGLCLLHQRCIQEEGQEQARELTLQLFDKLSAINNRIELRSFLFRLMRLISEKQIDRHDGQMLVYSCNLLLQTFPVRKPKPPEEERKVEIIWDLVPADVEQAQDATKPGEDSANNPDPASPTGS